MLSGKEGVMLVKEGSSVGSWWEREPYIGCCVRNGQGGGSQVASPPKLSLPLNGPSSRIKSYPPITATQDTHHHGP